MDGADNFSRDGFRLRQVANFGRHHQAFGSAALVRSAEGHHASVAHARNASGDFFHFVGINVAAAFDDQVLGAAGDIKFAIGLVGKVSGIEPAVLAGKLRGSGGIAIVAGGGRRSAKPQLSFGAFGSGSAIPGRNADFHVVQRIEIGRASCRETV